VLIPKATGVFQEAAASLGGGIWVTRNGTGRWPDVLIEERVVDEGSSQAQGKHLPYLHRYSGGRFEKDRTHGPACCSVVKRASPALPGRIVRRMGNCSQTSVPVYDSSTCLDDAANFCVDGFLVRESSRGLVP
jgi:hypothetical protein